MDLNEFQQDALTELINIGYGRAAGALSELVGHRVSVEVPAVSLHPLGEIGPILASSLSAQVAEVDQQFSGPVSGKAVLLMNQQSAFVLSRLLGTDKVVVKSFDQTTREILTEVGNILLNTCLGVLGNLLQIHVVLAVPHLQVKHVSRVVADSKPMGETPSHGLLVHTRFQVNAVEVSGYLLIVLGVTSFDRLMLELEKWEARGA